MFIEQPEEKAGLRRAAFQPACWGCWGHVTPGFISFHPACPDRNTMKHREGYHNFTPLGFTFDIIGISKQ